MVALNMNHIFNQSLISDIPEPRPAVLAEAMSFFDVLEGEGYPKDLIREVLSEMNEDLFQDQDELEVLKFYLLNGDTMVCQECYESQSEAWQEKRHNLIYSTHEYGVCFQCQCSTH